jgi:hypothetical protein
MLYSFYSEYTWLDLEGKARYHRIYKSRPLVRIMTQMKPAHILTTHRLNTIRVSAILHLIFLSKLMLSVESDN